MLHPQTSAQDQWAQEIKETAPLNPIGILPEVHTINPGSQNRSISEAEANKKSLTNNGKTKKQSQMKGKEEASETMLTEKEASQLSDTEFKKWL